MTDRTKIAIASFAHPHAMGYAAILQEDPTVDVLVADPEANPSDLTRGAAQASELGVRYVNSYDDLFDWKPDGVIVTSENARHRSLVERAAALGAHILCEKPLATNLTDARAMETAVQSADVIFMVAFPVHFSPAFSRLRSEHDSGLLGDLITIRGSNNGKLPMEREWFTDPVLSGGGALVDHVVHIAELVDSLTSARAVSVTSIANQILHADRAHAETAGFVTVTYDNGLIAAVDCSWSVPDTATSWGGLKLSIGGTGGTVDLDFFGSHVGGIDAITGRPVELRYGPSLDSVLLAAFLDAVRTGKQPQPNLGVGLRTLQIVLAAQESIRLQRTIFL